jgi:hypothetical protein
MIPEYLLALAQQEYEMLWLLKVSGEQYRAVGQGEAGAARQGAEGCW